MFPSHEDLKALTGYRMPARQRRWLLDNGYRFDVRTVALRSCARKWKRGTTSQPALRRDLPELFRQC
jgi:hypothetical protein